MGILGKLREAAEEAIGFTVAPVADYRRLQEEAEDFAAFRDEASEMAYGVFDYMTGRPQEMRPEKRIRLAQRSRIAFGIDPLAGREVEMLADFSFAKGIGRPQAKEDAVQKVIDEAWEANEEELTGFEAQRTLSNDLRTSANLFPLAFINGGKIRVGFLDSDTVTDVVPDPENRRRPLWYLARSRKFNWDFNEDRPKFDLELEKDGRPRMLYYEHWRNLAAAKAEREMDDSLDPLEEPPDVKKGEGLVYHVRINRLGEQHFGSPPFARSLRFYSAMNQFTEARVSMAHAASQFIAKRVVKGGQKRVFDAAHNVLAQTGEIAAFGSGELGQVREEQRAWGDRPAPSAPGSFWVENESHKLESLALNSGAAAAMQDAQIIRAPIAASSGFGQHYLGDASNTNLASATTLELPVLMMVGAWQQTFEQLYRWFTDRAIEAALHAGAFGGLAGTADALANGGKRLQELNLSEAADRAEAKDRTGLDLSYSFEMPYPGRRNLPDVVTTVVNVVDAYDPTGTNVPLRRKMLYFLFAQGLQDDEAKAAVDEILPADAKPDPFPVAAQQMAATEASKALAASPPTGGEPSQYGEQRQSTPADKVPTAQASLIEREWLPPDLQPVAAAHSDGTATLFSELVGGPALTAVVALNPPVAA